MSGCPICYSKNAKIESEAVDRQHIICPRCGDFEITKSLVSEIENKPLEARQRCIVSSLIRENTYEGFVLNTYNFNTYKDAKDISMLNRVDLLLQYVEKMNRSNNTLDYILESSNYEELLAITWSGYEISQLLTMAVEAQYLNVKSLNMGTVYSITLRGWERLAALEVIVKYFSTYHKAPLN